MKPLLFAGTCHWKKASTQFDICCGDRTDTSYLNLCDCRQSRGRTPCRLNVIAALPTDAQMAAGNHDLSLEFVNLEDEPPIEFDDPKISRWVEDCSAELHDAVYTYFQAQM